MEATAPPTGARLQRPLFAFANRLPVEKNRDQWRIAPGGLVTALRPALEAHRGGWVGWDGRAGDVPRRLDELAIDLYPVSLSRSEVQGYYRGFSNRTLWPLFHDLVEQPVFDWRWWRAYREANTRFAEVAAGLETKRKRPLLWVHDYHLMLLPELLRVLYPASPIAFFLHIPFPAPELFARLPWRAELLRGLLGADLVAFHADHFRGNFAGTCKRLLPDVRVSERHIELADGRRVETATHPISIDAKGLSDETRAHAVERGVRRLRKQFGGRRVLLGVDRLDYTKGILERLQALELLLARRPDLRNQLVFVQLAVPSRGDVHEYRGLRSQVDELVGRINGRFTEPGSDVPVHYLFRGVSRQRLLAYYRLADVALVTPLKDGMNLVAKEFVVAQAAGEGCGALVLSEFTGVAHELKDAVLCNPFDLEGLASRIEEALELDEDDRKKRLQRMAASVLRRDVYSWADEELGSAERASASSLHRGKALGKERSRPGVQAAAV